MPLASIIKSLLFGFTIALAVGPIALLIVNNGASRGFASASRSALGAGLADLTYATVAFLAGTLLVAPLEAHRAAFEVIAALVLIAFGAYMTCAAMRPGRSVDSGASATCSKGFATTYALTMLNPLTIIAFAGFAGQLPLAGSAGRALLLALAVFLGSITVQIALAAAGAQLGRALRNPAILKSLNTVSGLGIIAFGVAGLWPHIAVA